MKKLFFLVIAITGSLCAQSVTGQWKGKAGRPSNYGVMFSSVTATLTQSGSAVTGTVNLGANDLPISAGSAQGGAVRFVVNTGKSSINFTLTSSGGRLGGRATSDQGESATIDLGPSN